MIYLQKLVWAVIILTNLTDGLVLDNPQTNNTRVCATDFVNDDLLNSHHRLTTIESENNQLWNSTNVANRIASNQMKRQNLPGFVLTIPLHIHIVSDLNSSLPNDSQYVSSSRISRQVTYLNAVYNNFGISFNHISTTRTVNTTWASNGDDRAMKLALRRGSYRELNIYYQSALQSSSKTNPLVTAGQILLGFCSLPVSGITRSTPKVAYAQDGCNILSRTVPGGDLPAYSAGGTTIHEVGHWLGLLHTFQDYTCDPSDWGDYIADTPQQSKPSTGCPLTQDSCANSGTAPGDYATEPNGMGLPAAVVPSPAPGTKSPYGPQGFSGRDLVRNFMDYSDDRCYAGFTMGQVARMLNIWELYRLDK